MEQILAFVLGVGIALLVWGVVVAFKTVKKVKQIDQRITSHQDCISRNDELVNRRIDQEIDRTNNSFDTCIRHTDSRVDKLEAKLTSIPKEILKG
jgi:hypothetical protein